MPARATEATERAAAEAALDALSTHLFALAEREVSLATD